MIANIEICTGVKAVKYLYKYVYKGHDKVVVHVHENVEGSVINKIQQYQAACWVAALEAV